jgi:hypothetical protein
MDTINILEHYLQATRDGRRVRFGDEERTDTGEVDDVSVDSGPRRDYVKVTLKVPIPHCEGE